MKQLLFFILCAAALPVSAQQAVADVEHMHIAYAAVDNPLTIGVANCPCEKLSLAVDQGRLQEGPGPCEYIFSIDKPGKAVFTIRKKTNNGYVAAGQVTYRVKPLPLPEATIGRRRNSSMPVALFKAEDGMIAKLDGFDFDVRFKVTSFHMEVIRDGKVYLEAQNNNNVFEPVTRTVISHVLPGDTISFSHIMCSKPDDKEVELESFLITITK